jgi:hypothetical protein
MLTAPTVQCPPRLATPRRRPTYGHRAAAVSAVLGRPAMAWQRALFDVALEVDELGVLWYRTVVVVVPRQQGKSTALSAVMVERALAGLDRTIAYTAQDRGIAAERIVEQLYDRQLVRSRLRPYVKVRRTNGSERIMFTPNGSRIMVTAPTETAGHGLTLDLGLIDEAWSQRDMALPQAFLPAMVTRPEAQLWVVSTIGDGSDELLQFYQRAGVAALEDPASRVCYLEWSADPEDDPDDPDVWAACMPALGHTVTLDTIRAQRDSLPAAEFERAYLCRRPPAGALERVIPEPVWAAAARPDVALGDPVVFAVEVTWDRSAATIAACGTAAGGRAVEVIDHRPGTGWLVDRVLELYGRWRPGRIVVDTGGPAAPIYAELAARRVPVVDVTARDVATACGAFYDDVVNGRLYHRGDTELDAAVAGAARRALANAWAWERRTPSVDISPLVAVTLARWGHAAGPAEAVFRAR